MLQFLGDHSMAITGIQENMAHKSGEVGPLAYKGREIVSVTTTPYTISSSDVGKCIVADSGSAIVLELNDEVFSPGEEIQVIQLGLGVPTLTPQGTEVINGLAAPGAQYQSVTLKKVATDVYVGVV